MPDYRIYAFDAQGHIAGPPRLIVCDTDQEAEQQARALLDGRVLEVWHLARQVARIEPPAGRL
jgi:hypothetical protein